MVAQTAPWKQHHYIGEYANDGLADAAVTALGWATTAGLLYYDTTLTVLKLNTGAAWVIIGGPASDTFTATIVVGNTVAGDVAGVNCNVADDIQSGIDLLPEAGGKLHIKRGEYNPAAALDTIPPNSVIEGEAHVQINKPVGLNLFEIAIGEDNIALKGLEILNGAGDITGGHLISVVDANSLSIVDCGFFNNPGEDGVVEGDGIHIEGATPATATRIKITRCFFDTCGRGIYAESTDATGITVSDVSIIDCDLIDSLREVIYLLLTGDCTIENTRVTVAGSDGAFSGVLIQGKGSGATEVTIRHAINKLWVSGATADGVLLDHVDKTVLTQVHSHDNADDGISLIDSDLNQIMASYFTDNTDDGIDIDGTSDRNIVTNNHALGNAAQIVDLGTNTIKANNIIA